MEMKMKNLSVMIAWFWSLSCIADAFTFSATWRSQSDSSGSCLRSCARSYLDSLSASPQSIPRVVQQQASTFSLRTSSSARSPTFAHASRDYFALERLKCKGVRATKDWGAPEEGTRPLAETDDEVFAVGSWSCTEGGWPSPNEKGHTEIFYMLQGHGCLSDADGVKHYFGPGDTVIIPKGHTGRWDVYETIHKVWAVNDHANIEEKDRPIRVQVHHYHDSVASHHLTAATNGNTDPLYCGQAHGSTVSFQVLYSVGQTQVGTWACDTTGISFSLHNLSHSIFAHLFEGVLFLTDSRTNESRRCVPGDTFMLPKGWNGHVDILKPAKKLWTTAL